MLYHSWKSENLGYLVFFIIYATVMFLFKDYINSGFYAVINETLDWASIYFDTEGLQTYNERISNRYVAVTVAVSIIGVAENVLLNNYILRRARYIVAIGLALTLNVTAFYMELEPDTIYSIMVLLGIFMTFVLKCGRHFYLSRRDHIFGKVKKGLSYNLDYRSLWQGMLIVGIYVLVVIAGMSIIYDKRRRRRARIRKPAMICSRILSCSVSSESSITIRITAVCPPVNWAACLRLHWTI